MRHEHLALLVRQLLERRPDLLEQQLTNDGRLRSVIRCRQQILERIVLVLALAWARRRRAAL